LPFLSLFDPFGLDNFMAGLDILAEIALVCNFL
jgi:hypothetical protein